jgi:hypothetical protein
MVVGDGMDDLFPISVLARQVGADLGIGTLHFMIHCFADVVQEAGPFGLFHVIPDSRGHGASRKATSRECWYVLGEAGPVLELADLFDKFGIDPVDPHVEGGPLPPSRMAFSISSWALATISSMRPGWIGHR